MNVDWLIVGAGYVGCVLAERIATQLDQRVVIVDRRNHIGGNAFDRYDQHGILIHQYGPHIFHTNSKRVWAYLSQFTNWHQYYHQARAEIDGKMVPVPFNLNSLHALFPAAQADRLENELLAQFGPESRVPILQLRKTTNKHLRELADYIYDNMFVGYTAKQWNMKPEELDTSVTNRVMVGITRDNRYFQDAFQCLPSDGYTNMFRKMLTHENIHMVLGTDYRALLSNLKFKRMIYTGPLDAFFDYSHGELPYRSLQFEFVNYETEKYQEFAVINYPNSHAYTRISEYKHMTGQQSPTTTVAVEYPRDYSPGCNEPYYPVPKEENHELVKLYQREIRKLNGSVIFAGRLADYKYYNMDQAVARALQVFEKVIVRSEVSLNLLSSE